MKRSIWRLAAALGACVFLMAGAAQAQSQDGDGDGLWYTLDELNVGLGAPPEDVIRITPREAIRSFQALTDQEEYADAAHILNLSDIDPAEQPERGAELARKLSEVLKRGDWLTASSLPARQDAAIESTAGENPMAGKPRRDIELTALEVGGDTFDVRMGRYFVEGGEPAWLIMPESVASIDLLYEEYGPSWLEGHLPESLKTNFGLLMVWEWIAIPVFLVLITSLGWGVYRVFDLLSHWLPPGSVTIYVSQIKMPVSLIVVSLVTQMLLDYVVSFSAIATTTFRILLIIVMAWGVGTIALRLVDTLMLRMARKLVGEIDDTKPKDDRRLLTTLYAVRRVIILLTVTTVAVYVLGQIQLFETLGLSLLASASVLAVLVGIAGQAVLGNILSSLQLSLAKPIRIGDLVMFEGHWCYVEGIFYTYIRLRIWNERRLIVPVTYFVSRPFENLSVKNAKNYRSFEMTLHISADIEVLRKQFYAFAEQNENVIELHNLYFYLTAQQGAQQTMTGYFVASDPFAGWVAENELREQMLTYLRNHYPEWWPRDIVVLSHEDMAKGDGAKTHYTVKGNAAPKPDGD
ncbi:mechanosensitive ion channel family protein [Halomonas sp. HNIBRBA4712]|uniref:mechanosensitive ion channel family protein n=1 Tax=Halomonas sp. HNIBRBA4712 TaxID=3373087 RepID=UPI0037453549